MSSGDDPSKAASAAEATISFGAPQRKLDSHVDSCMARSFALAAPTRRQVVQSRECTAKRTAGLTWPWLALAGFGWLAFPRISDGFPLDLASGFHLLGFCLDLLRLKLDFGLILVRLDLDLAGCWLGFRTFATFY